MKFLASPGRSATGVALIVLAAAALAFALFLPIRGEVVQYDEAGYTSAALRIREDGLFSKFTFADQRTYLYPGLLALVSKRLEVSDPATRFSVFVIQTVLFLGGAVLIWAALRARFEAGHAWLIFVAFSLNPINLLYLGYVLTESLSLLFTLAFVTAVALSFGPGTTLTLRHAASSGLLLGAALMARPGTIYLLALGAAALVLHLYQGFRAGRLGRTMLACLVAVAGLTLMTLPQWINNYRNFGKLSPLVVHDAGSTQFALGQINLKYGTFVGPGDSPGLGYRNPFYGPEPGNREQSVVQRLKARICSTAAKMFALVDQDFIRPYIFSLTSRDRWLGTIFSLTLFCLGLTGLLHQAWTSCKALWSSQFRHLTPEHAFALACLGAILACFALYSQIQVESRFGLPILALTALFIPAAVDLWRGLKPAFRQLAIVLFLSAIGAGCYFSHWIQTLSEPIVRAWG